MTIRTSRLGAALAAVAAATMVATPAMAGGWGWDGHRRHHRDGIDAGDVLTGILIIGGIAAIASAASSNDRDRRREERRDYDDYQEPPRPRELTSANGPSWTEGGIGNAVDRCMGEIASADGRDGVDSVSRAGEGWRVQGHTGEGRAFSCTVDGNGRIRNISVEGEAY